MSRKVAGAPITWGVCEAPGWGATLAPRRVLDGMRACGLAATELGPPGWLATDPGALGDTRLVAGFLAVVLHKGERAAVGAALDTVTDLAAAGAQVLVLAAATGLDGYDARPPLSDEQWRALVRGAHAVADAADAAGLTPVLHPHVGTCVERPEEIDAFVADTMLGLCLDTGHVLVGGGDPVAVAAAHRDRVEHVHLKDVDAALAARVARGDTTYAAAVAAGLYRPLGTGDVDVAAIVASLDAAGYDGWLVLEQDAAFPAADEAAAATADAAAAASVAYLQTVTTPPTDTPRSRR